jgi:hypothetical protein
VVLTEVRESPLSDVMFESYVSTLSLVLDYSRIMVVGQDETWGHDVSVSREVHMNLTETQVHTPEVHRSPQFVTTQSQEKVTRSSTSRFDHPHTSYAGGGHEIDEVTC